MLYCQSNIIGLGKVSTALFQSLSRAKGAVKGWYLCATRLCKNNSYSQIQNYMCVTIVQDYFVLDETLFVETPHYKSRFDYINFTNNMLKGTQRSNLLSRSSSNSSSSFLWSSFELPSTLPSAMFYEPLLHMQLWPAEKLWLVPIFCRQSEPRGLRNEQVVRAVFPTCKLSSEIFENFSSHGELYSCII